MEYEEKIKMLKEHLQTKILITVRVGKNKTMEVPLGLGLTRDKNGEETRFWTLYENAQNGAEIEKRVKMTDKMGNQLFMAEHFLVGNIEEIKSYEKE